MDKIDREIIGCLERDARLSFRELGELVHLSANAVAERVRRLQQQGVICGYHAELDLKQLGLPLQALIDVKMRPETSADAFEQALLMIDGVRSAFLLTGTFDYQLLVACKDQADLVRLIEALRERAGVKETYSRIVLRQLRHG